MVDRRFKPRTGHNQQLWPVLLLLVLAVVVPTACVLWFMSEAMTNERLAVRHKLTEVYRGQLVAIKNQVRSHWQDRVEALIGIDRNRAGSEIFADVISAELADSVILYDSSGQLIYPTKAVYFPAGDSEDPPEWEEARKLEYQQDDPAAAAEVYAQIAERATYVNMAARALQAQARCLAKVGQREAAIEVLTDKLANDRYRHAPDTQGRLIQPNALLLGLQLISDPQSSRFDSTAELLVRRLTDYSDSTLPTGQRRFLMRQLQKIMPDCPPFSTLAAEEMAAEYLELNPAPTETTYLFPFHIQESWQATPSEEAAPYLRPTRMRRVWQFASSDKTVVALFTQQRILSDVQKLSDDQALPADVTVALLPTGTNPVESAAFSTIPAGSFLPGWQLTLHLRDQALFDTSADKQIAAYLWTGALFVVVIVALASLVASYVGRQMKLTRLKNDLVATVSHELKTPLSSMRMLVDTLLDGHYQDKQKTREYLQLIDKENTRLSRLIDNFLTFSRMERNKRSFEFTEAKPADIASAALEAIREKFESAGFRLEVDIAPDLPSVIADPDAMVTVVLNLLDNAYKYSADDKHVILRAYQKNDAVCFEVEDRGIGLSRRATQKVFDRFYQVDQRLSRKVEGCGLGLSIVKFIVAAHGGSIAVASQPGQGSKFAVQLPSAGSEASQKLLRVSG